MSARKSLIYVKLQVRVEDESSGTTKYKNLSLSKIKLTVTDAELLEAGTAIAELQTRNLSSIRSVVTGDLVEE